MDPHDNEFETFLRQFRLRMPGPIQETVSRRRQSAFRLVLAAAAIVIVSLTGLMLRNHRGVDGPTATVVEPGEPSLYKAGERIAVGTVVQSNSAKGLTLALNDGSRVEMRSQSELQLESAADGIRIRLNDGSIVVTAARQGSGHLYVQTKDALVSVVGTVFLVHAEQAGTRVAVVEGEVHVQLGTEVKKLLPGEQVATNPSIRLNGVTEEISWSQHSVEYEAMLPQTAAPVAALKPAPAVAQPTSPSVTRTVQPLDPPSTGEGKRIFDRTCTACHSADVATKIESRSQQASIADRELLIQKRAELDNLRMTMTDRADANMQVLAEINRLVTQGADVRKIYEGYVSGHLTGFGVLASDMEVRSVAGYLFEALGKQTNPNPPARLAPQPDSPGRNIFYRACTTCHSAEVTINSSLSTRAEYVNLVSRQLGMGASVSSAEVPVLVDYLFEAFGKKSAPPTPSDIPLQKQ